MNKRTQDSIHTGTNALKRGCSTELYQLGIKLRERMPCFSILGFGSGQKGSCSLISGKKSNSF